MNTSKRLTVAAGVGIVALAFSIMSAAPTDSLHDAAKRGDVAGIKVLVTAGADVNAKATNNLTPMHIAAFEGRAGAINALAIAGAEVDAKGPGNNTPLHAAAIDALTAAGADINAKAALAWISPQARATPRRLPCWKPQPNRRHTCA